MAPYLILNSILLLSLPHRSDAFSSSSLYLQNLSRQSRLSKMPSTADADDVTATAAAYTKIDGISSPELLDKYDTFLLDMWGGEFFLINV